MKEWGVLLDPYKKDHSGNIKEIMKKAHEKPFFFDELHFSSIISH